MPWTNLPALGSPTYVLAEDRPYVDEFNRTAAVHHSIVTNQIPEPWLGPVNDACLFVLQLNPHCLPSHTINADKHGFIGKKQAPHFGITSQDKWWLSCLKTLARDIGKSLQPTSPATQQLDAGYKYLETRVCSVEYFPYGSDKYSHSHLRLPSQEASFDVVRNAVKLGAYIAVMKGRKDWVGAVPELGTYSKLGVLKGFQGAKHITPTSCPLDYYQSLLTALLNCKGL